MDQMLMLTDMELLDIGLVVTLFGGTLSQIGNPVVLSYTIDA